MKQFIITASILAITLSGFDFSQAEEPPRGLILFGRDNAALPSGNLEIGKIAAAIQAAPTEATFVVEGHASDLGPDDVNMTFSRLRAEWVKAELVEQHKVESNRIEIVAKGETTPSEAVAAGDSPDEKRRKRAANRRVEVKWKNEKGILLALSKMNYTKANTRGIDTKKIGEKMTKPEISESAQSIVSSVNQLAIDLYRAGAQNDPEGNVLLSPHSIGQALLMTRMGAAQQTAKVMDEVMHLEGIAEKAVGKDVAELREILDSAAEGSAAFNSANALAILGEKGKALPTYEKTLKESFSAQVLPNATVDSVNGWVADETNGKIDTLLEEIDPDSRLILLNALYFKADWASQFDSEITEPTKFTQGNGKVIEVPMMNDTRKVSLVVQNDYRALALPYKGGDFVWLAVLPAEDKAEKLLSEGLSEKEWAELVEQGAAPGTRKVRVGIPRHDLNVKTQLSAALKGLGMEEAFGDKADFSKMSEEALKISEVVHAVNLTVNESGSEAAAATAVVMKSRGLARPPEPFVLDRPFLFAIAEARTGTLVVLGRISDLGEDLAP